MVVNDMSKELSVREIQLESLQILKVIDEICHRESLRYWLMYGSLIGVVRHHAFIPWDDDLDIAMPREDYERFLTYFSKHSDELRPLVALEPLVGKNQPFLITRISNTEFKMVGEYGDYLDNLGTFVDIYPLDGLGDDASGSVSRAAMAHNLILNYLRACNFKYNNQNSNLLKKLVKNFRSLTLGNPSRYQSRLDTLCKERSFDSSKYVCNMSWEATSNGPLYERSWFEDTRRMQFEDMLVPVPSGYDSLLKYDFGDYMQLPPEEDRVGHHFYSIVRREI